MINPASNLLIKLLDLEVAPSTQARPGNWSRHQNLWPPAKTSQNRMSQLIFFEQISTAHGLGLWLIWRRQTPKVPWLRQTRIPRRQEAKILIKIKNTLDIYDAIMMLHIYYIFKYRNRSIFTYLFSFVRK